MFCYTLLLEKLSKTLYYSSVMLHSMESSRVFKNLLHLNIWNFWEKWSKFANFQKKKKKFKSLDFYNKFQ
jgi:hypothetical protein